MAMKMLRVGVRPNNLHLTLAQHWPDSFADLDARLVRYSEGRDTNLLKAISMWAAPDR